MKYEVHPEKILDRQEKKLHKKKITMAKKQWKNHSPEEATWELEKEMKRKFQTLF